MWLAADATFYTGGVAYSNGVATNTRQSNSRAGLTCSLPIGKRQSIKLSVATGVSARVGSDFTTVGAAYQFAWFDRQ